MRRTGHPGRTWPVAVVLALLVATGCASDPTEPAAANAPTTTQPKAMPSTTVAVLTPDGTDRFDITTGAQSIVARAPSTNVGENLRIYGVADDAEPSLDQRACVTWASGIEQIAQPGIALRVRTDGDRVRGVLVTNNILFGARWGFNLQVTDSAAETPITKFGTLWVDWANDPLPWRLCARVVGNTVTVKVWPTQIGTTPEWTDTQYAVSYELPPGWDEPGRPAFYVGHLRAGQSLRYSAFDVATG